MTYDPNDNRPDLRDRRPDLVNNNVDARRSSSWVPWVAVLAVLLIGAFIWGKMGGEPGTDPAQPTLPRPHPPTRQHRPLQVAPRTAANLSHIIFPSRSPSLAGGFSLGRRRYATSALLVRGRLVLGSSPRMTNGQTPPLAFFKIFSSDGALKAAS